MLRYVYLALAHLPDAWLVSQAKRGSRQAYGYLYIKYMDQVYRFAYFRLNQDEQTAWDICQETFVKAQTQLGKYEERGFFRAWLLRIAQNCISDYGRQKQRIQPMSDGYVSSHSEGEEIVVEQELQTSLVNAVSSLPQMQKDVVLMKYVEGMSAEEIGKVMGKRADAVRALLHRAMVQLRKELADYE